MLILKPNQTSSCWDIFGDKAHNPPFCQQTPDDSTHCEGFVPSLSLSLLHFLENNQSLSPVKTLSVMLVSLQKMYFTSPISQDLERANLQPHWLYEHLLHSGFGFILS